jgi:hypothetical protein
VETRSFQSGGRFTVGADTIAFTSRVLHRRRPTMLAALVLGLDSVAA